MSGGKSCFRGDTGRFWLVMAGCAVVWGAGWWLQDTSAAVKARRDPLAEKLVKQALHEEVEGARSERAKLLQSAVKESPGYGPARWHSGQIWYANKWTSIDDVPKLSAKNRRVVAYQNRRDSYPQTIEGQLELASWCRKMKLGDQERAHLTKVLEINPDHAEARARLGFRQVDGIWLGAQEVREAEGRVRQTVQAVREWKPKLEQILSDVVGDKKYQRQTARERLDAIDDPAVIPVMEMLFSTRSERTAEILVEKLDKMAAHEASVSLARHAVFSPWESVRDMAADKLKSRSKESFVPVLLSAMYTPVQSRAELYQGPDGRLTYRHVLYREGQKQKEVAVFDTAYQDMILPGSRSRTITAATQRAEERELAVTRQNEITEELNERICGVLATATEQESLTSPESWWQWWNDYNEVYVEGEKPVRQRYRREQANPGPQAAVASGMGMEAMVSAGIEKMSDCLAAGTVVWTETGAVPIERVKPGDRVLSQDPETGELAYKPVLATTIRPTGPLCKIHLGDDSFQCSGGHPFWISGEGWVKARHLKAGSRLHQVSGTHSIASVSDGGNEQTYNLIVADFHTYFIGQAKILSHDNTVREPTNAIVPGLMNR